MFWFMLIALVAVVAAVALAVLGNGGALPDARHNRLDDPLPADRPLHPADLEELRIAVTLRGYRMTDVDDVLDRVAAELAERDARISELEAALAGAHDAALGGPGTLGRPAFGGPAYGGSYEERRPYPPYRESQAYQEPQGYPENPAYQDGPSHPARPGYGGPPAPHNPQMPAQGTPPGPGPSLAKGGDPQQPRDGRQDPWGRHGE